MYDWVRALIDPIDIPQSPSSARKRVTPPPKYELPPLESPVEKLSPSRTRSRRSASPSKRTASPRKPKTAKATKETTDPPAGVPETIHETVEANGVHAPPAQSPKAKAPTRRSKRIPTPLRDVQTPAQEDAPKAEEKSEPPAKDGEVAKPAEETTKEAEPPLLPELPPEADPKKLVSEAKEMVENASKEQNDEQNGENDEPAQSSKKTPGKRKTDALSEGEEDEAESEARVQRTKRAKVLENKLKRERVRNRALVGVTAALAVA